VSNGTDRGMTEPPSMAGSCALRSLFSSARLQLRNDSTTSGGIRDTSCRRAGRFSRRRRGADRRDVFLAIGLLLTTDVGFTRRKHDGIRQKLAAPISCKYVGTFCRLRNFSMRGPSRAIHVSPSQALLAPRPERRDSGRGTPHS
jgi:hypothetical protein